MFNKLKNYISVNIMSAIGYYYLLFYCWIYFIVVPNELNNAELQKYYNQIYSEPGSYAMSIDEYSICFIRSVLIFTVLLFIFGIEHILHKKNIIKFQTPDNIIYKIFFYVGIICQFIPVLYILKVIICGLFFPKYL